MWQLLIVLYFIFASASYLLRRVLAQKLRDHNREINAIFFLFFLLPAAIFLSFFFPHNLNVGPLNLFLLFGGSIIWPILSIISFHANKDVDVGIFTIITNLSPVFTMVIALPFLHESISNMQSLGIMLLILSGILAASSQLNKHNRASINGILVCILSAIVLGVAVAYEGFMLGRVDFGTYLIFGWGSQIIWSAILAHKELRKIPQLFSKVENRQTLIVWGSTRVLGSVAFVSALKISGSASIISAASDFLSVSVVIAAYFFLKEHRHMVYKLLATSLGVVGLLLIAK
ncbi:DMT family transporter [Candidatus Daviesbacteria bacterium]|nr:DMT family transporter [Candidatus Daviesbacteria bacterium]